MARNFSQNLGEETYKGMLQKARSGLYPRYAPVGYRNVEGPDERRVIVPDNDAPTVTRLFDEFATGQYSLKTLAAKCRAEGWTIRGRRIATSTLHQILRKRIYTGDFDWDGVTYTGRHDALVSRETWDRVQSLIDKRVETRQHRIRHDFAFTGFVRCGHCGCQLVGELKKEKYVYYHCTGHHGKCAEPYTREEAMQDQFAASLRELVVPPGVLAWLKETVSESDLNERASREREIARLEEQRRRLDSKLDAMYEDRLEARITPEMYDRKASDLRGQSLALSRRIDEIRAAAPAAVEDAIDLMDLTSRAADLFAVQPVQEKQGFLRLILKSATWRHRELQTEFEQPFENLRRSNQLSSAKHKENGTLNTEIDIWLPGMVSNPIAARCFVIRKWRITRCNISHRSHGRGSIGTPDSCRCVPLGIITSGSIGNAASPPSRSDSEVLIHNKVKNIFPCRILLMPSHLTSPSTRKPAPKKPDPSPAYATFQSGGGQFTGRSRQHFPARETSN
jgi:hypothetical protein